MTFFWIQYQILYESYSTIIGLGDFHFHEYYSSNIISQSLYLYSNVTFYDLYFIIM